MESPRPLFGYAGVGLQHARSLTTSFLSTLLRNPPSIRLIPWIIPSFPTHPASLKTLLQQRLSSNQILSPSHKITEKHRLEAPQSSLLLTAMPTPPCGQGAQGCVQLNLENLHSLSGFLLWCLTTLTVPIFFLYVQFESPLLQHVILASCPSSVPL